MVGSLTSLVLHGGLVLFVALAIGGEELAYRFPEEPDFHCALVPKGPFIGFERTPDWYGRWPMKCNHRSLLRAMRNSDDRVGDDLHCEVCGPRWWEIRGSFWE